MYIMFELQGGMQTMQVVQDSENQRRCDSENESERRCDSIAVRVPPGQECRSRIEGLQYGKRWRPVTHKSLELRLLVGEVPFATKTGDTTGD